MHRFSTRLALPAIAVTAGIALMAGCDSPTAGAAAPAVSNQVMPGMSMPPAGSSGTAPAQDAPVATDAVTIANFAYSPVTMTVKTGSTVTWTNRDSDPHTVTAMSGPFHSPTLSNGQSFRFTFTSPGRFEYLCTIHPFMTAIVVVTP